MPDLDPAQPDASRHRERDVVLKSGVGKHPLEIPPTPGPARWRAGDDAARFTEKHRISLRPDLPPPPSPRWPARTTAELRGAKPDPAAFAALPRAPISVVLDDVRSLANVGLIFRLCDAVRAERLYLCGITGHPSLPDPALDPRLPGVQERADREIQKTAVMAVPFVPWEYRRSAVETIAELRDHGYQVAAVEQAHGSQPYTTPGIYRPPLCLVLGHERAGVAPAALRLADVCLEVPVYGMANSLNVAMAFALVAYEAFRQHDGFGLASL